jgi:hypothetical protein
MKNFGIVLKNQPIFQKYLQINFFMMILPLKIVLKNISKKEEKKFFV